MNKIIKGENLSVMQSILPEYKCKVKLIYIDPPYNTGNTKFVYKDKMKSDAWLLFMRERLQVAKEFLRDDGVIFVSIDDHEQAYLKVLMDEVFGRENFVADFIRKTKSTTNNAKNGVNIQHENCLCFAKNKQSLFLSGDRKTFENYKNPDSDPLGGWVVTDPTAPTGYYYGVTNPHTGRTDWPPQGRQWSMPEERFKEIAFVALCLYITPLIDHQMSIYTRKFLDGAPAPTMIAV